MKAKIISDSLVLTTSIKQVLDYFFVNIEAENLVIVDLNFIVNPEDKRTQRLGLEVARTSAKNPNNVVILFSFESVAWLMQNELEFVGLMSLPNVGFVDADNLQKIWDVYRALSFEAQIDNPAGRGVYEFEKKQRLINCLIKDLDDAQFHHHKLQLVLNEARKKLGFTGGDIEVTNQIIEGHQSGQKPFVNQFLPGIFIDASGSLFDSNWRLNRSVKAAVARLAIDKGRSVLVISGNDDKLVKEKLVDNDIDWQFVPKSMLKGAELETVVNGSTKIDFELNYGINVHQFIHVADL